MFAHVIAHDKGRGVLPRYSGLPAPALATSCRYLIVGGEAVIFHGYPRVTGDVDFFYENTPANTRRLFNALLDFWEGRIPGIAAPEELRKLGIILQFGRPPHRIDLMNRIDGVSFSEAWAGFGRPIQLGGRRSACPTSAF